MKQIKRFLIATFAVVGMAMSAVGFSACNMHFHQYGEGEVTKEATCGVAGVMTFTCECGFTQTEEIPALEHNVKQVEAQESTCVTPGWNAYEYCENCDYTTKVELPLGDHTEMEYEAQASTCTEQGWNAYVGCKYCDYAVDKVLLPLEEHKKVSHEAQESTCTEQGWNAYETCENCDYTTKELLPLAAHTEIAHEAQESTCSEQGWNAYISCKNCDYNTKELLPLAALVRLWTGHVPFAAKKTPIIRRAKVWNMRLQAKGITAW